MRTIFMKHATDSSSATATVVVKIDMGWHVTKYIHNVQVDMMMVSDEQHSLTPDMFRGPYEMENTNEEA